MNANNEITLEVCSNTEALREFCGFDVSRVEDGLENEAAAAWHDEIVSRLEGAGFNTERAKGQRTLCHGWNGANTFSHKLGPVGTFDDLTQDQIDLIFSLTADAEEAIYKQFAAN